MLIERHDIQKNKLPFYKEKNVSKTSSTSKNKSLVEDKGLKNKSKTKKSIQENTNNSDKNLGNANQHEDMASSKDLNMEENVLEVELLDEQDDSSFIDKLDSFDEDENSNEEYSEFSSLENIEEINEIDDSFDVSSLTFDNYDEFNEISTPIPALASRNQSHLPEVSKPRLPNIFSKDNLNLYLSEISAFPMLKPEEELEYARKVRDENDPDAAFRLVSSHLRLVVRIAMEFQRRWMQNVLDLIQEGNIGLLRAVNKFDSEKGIKFSYYATFWIRAYILKFIMDNWRMVKIGTTQAQRKLFYNLNKEKQKLIAQGFDPDIEILSDKLGVSKEHIIEMEQRLDSTDLSLDMPVGDDNNVTTRLDYLPALTQGVEEGFAESEITDIIHTKLESLLPKLSDKEVFILENRILTDDPITLREIGEKYNVTRERIRQLEARLVTKLKNYLSDEIEDFSEDWIQK